MQNDASRKWNAIPIIDYLRNGGVCGMLTLQPARDIQHTGGKAPLPSGTGGGANKKAGRRNDLLILRELGGATLQHLLTRATAARSVL